MNFSKLIVAAVVSLTLATPDLAQASVVTPVRAMAGSDIGLPGFQLAKAKRHNRLKPGCRAAHCKPGLSWAKYRKWQKKKYFGRVIAGVALGTIFVTAANAVPRRPSNDLCWYWANPSRTRGFWVYCY